MNATQWLEASAKVNTSYVSWRAKWSREGMPKQGSLYDAVMAQERAVAAMRDARDAVYNATPRRTR